MVLMDVNGNVPYGCQRKRSLHMLKENGPYTCQKKMILICFNNTLFVNESHGVTLQSEIHSCMMNCKSLSLVAAA